MHTRPKALLDTNTLAPARLRDLLIRLDIEGLIEAYASEETLAEMDVALRKGWPHLSEEQRGKAVEFVRTSLAGKLVEAPAKLVEQMELPEDPDDRHVAIAAYEVGAFVVTYNLKHFPEKRLKPWNLKAISPDAFLLPVAKRSPRRFLDVVASQEADFGTDRRWSLLERLEEHDRLVKTAPFLRSLL